jgi:hypothetical protein
LPFCFAHKLEPFVKTGEQRRLKEWSVVLTADYLTGKNDTFRLGFVTFVISLLRQLK